MKLRLSLIIGMLLFLRPAWSGQGDNPQVVLQTNLGRMVVELFPDDAPATVENFLSYVNSGFYDGLVFHRVMKDFMIQGGGFYVVGNYIYNLQAGEPIINESYNGLENLRGTIAMARSTDPNSATSQFYINHVDNPSLDRANAEDGYGYCVFGKVVTGMDVVDAIAEVPTIYVSSSLKYFPADPVVVIEQARPISYYSADISDFNGDGEIEYADVAEFMSGWLAEECDSRDGYCEGFDLDYNGMVGFYDFALFGRHWHSTD